MKPKKLYCLYCDKFRTFVFSKIIGHSKCISCGSRFGVNEKNPVLIHFLNKENLKSNNNLTKKIIKLENRIKEQRKHIARLLDKK